MIKMIHTKKEVKNYLKLKKKYNHKKLLFIAVACP